MLLTDAQGYTNAPPGRARVGLQAAGLVSLSLRLSRRYADDHEMLAHGMVVYDALYLWCGQGQDETHSWNPAPYRAVAGA